MRLWAIILLLSSSAFAGSDNFSSHIQTASDSKQNMNTRWSALFKAAHFSEAQDLIQLKKFLKSKEWYMRNAAILALQKINPVEAVIEAKMLLNDKALVVRSAAVDIISRNLNSENKKILIEEMGKSYNFHKQKGLWIRKQILQNIATTADIQDRDIFAKALFDSDSEISEISANVLEKITGQQIDKANFVERWKALVKEKNWL